MIYFCACMHVASDQVQIYKQLCATVEPTIIGEILQTVNEADCEDFYLKYLHDFVRLAHRCKHKNQEDDIQEYEVSIRGRRK